MRRDLTVPGAAALASETEERLLARRAHAARRHDGQPCWRASAPTMQPAQRFLHTDPRARALYQLRAWQVGCASQTDSDARLLALRYSLTQTGEQLAVRRSDGRGLRRAQTPAPGATVRLELRAAEIRSSLFAAADAVRSAGRDHDAARRRLLRRCRLSPRSAAAETASPSSTRCATSTASRSERAQSQPPSSSARCVRISRISRGAAPTAARATTRRTARALRRAFLRSPLEFTRVTSGFSLARFHPFIADVARAHKGVDFAAPSGTPVRAAGDGTGGARGPAERLRQRGRAAARGRISRRVYAHLSRFAVGV